MGRVRAKVRGYAAGAIRDAGEAFDWSGPLGSWMEPLDGTFEEWGAEPVEVEAPEAYGNTAPEPTLSQEVADLEGQVAAFDHDRDGRVGGSPKGGLARRPKAGGLRKRA